MRIWAFPSFYPYDFPGLKWTGIFAHRQYKALVGLGAEVAVLQPVLWHPPAPFHTLNANWKEVSVLNYPDSRVYDGIKVYHPKIANRKPGRIFNTPYPERYVHAVVKFFKDNNIQLHPERDVFYAQWLPEARLVNRAAKVLGVRSAVLAVGDDVLVLPQSSDSQMMLFKEALEGADIRLAVAEYLADEANKLLPQKVPFNVVRRGVNHDFFRPFTVEEKGRARDELGLPRNKLVILMIGAGIERKGWLDLFDALGAVKKSGQDFVLAGVYGASGEVDLKEEAKKRGMEEQFFAIGEVEPAKMNIVHNAADIFCLPSHSEGIANSVVEAMATGVPVVTTAICGHPELITNGVNGIMVQPRMPHELYTALRELLSDIDKRKEIGATARRFIVEEWGNYAYNAAKLYELLDGTKPAVRKISR